MPWREIKAMAGNFDDPIRAERDQVIKHLLMQGPLVRRQFVHNPGTDGLAKLRL